MKIDYIDIHTFGDASKKGLCTAIYAVVKQGKKTYQGLLAAKARLEKKGVTISRANPGLQMKIDYIDIHTLGDASKKGLCTAIYAVVSQGKKTYQGHFAAKARLAKKGLTIPRLGLVSAQMSSNHMYTAKQALSGLPINHTVV